jgi:predicted ferric reductase
MVNPIFILVLVLIVAIWLIIEFKRFRHKILAVFLIVLILFTYFSFASVVKGKDLDLKTFSGMKEAGKLYFVWLGNIFKNVKVMTANAINLSWSINETSELNKTLKSNDSLQVKILPE